MNRASVAMGGFTILELIIVIAIIAILAGLILNTAGYIQKKGASSRAETEIAALTVALENYKADNGDYPHGTNANGANRALEQHLSVNEPDANERQGLFRVQQVDDECRRQRRGPLR